MKIILLLLITVLIGCKQNENINEENPLSYDSYRTKMAKAIFGNKSIPKKDQKLFMNYQLNMTKSAFNNATKTNIQQNLAKIINDTVYLDLEKTCNFTIKGNFKNNQLKAIYLNHFWKYSTKSNSYNHSPFYKKYYDILQSKYGKPICNFVDTSDVTDTRGALWIKDGIAIHLDEWISISSNTNIKELISTSINYIEVKSQQKWIKDLELEEKEEKMKLEMERNRIKVDNLKKDSIARSKF